MGRSMFKYHFYRYFCQPSRMLRCITAHPHTPNFPSREIVHYSTPVVMAGAGFEPLCCRQRQQCIGLQRTAGTLWQRMVKYLDCVNLTPEKLKTGQVLPSHKSTIQMKALAWRCPALHLGGIRKR
ncbi:hypothetical protein FKM82_003780 [Ascaphus truei]